MNGRWDTGGDPWQDMWQETVADAERAGEGYEVPVELVRTRVRRRRTARAAARGGTALGVVGALVVAAPLLLDVTRGTGAPAADDDQAAALTRCGLPADLPQDDVEGFAVEIEETDRTVHDDRVVHLRTRVVVAPPTAEAVTIDDTRVELVSDGVVVAVADGRATVGLTELEAVGVEPAEPGAASGLRATVSTRDFATGLVACVPDVTGAARVPAGEYELAVTETIRWDDADRTGRTTRVSRTLPVTLTDDPPPSVGPDPAECVADASLLTAPTGSDAERSALTVDAVVPAAVDGDDRVRLTVRVTNEGTEPAVGLAERPSVLLTSAGRVWRAPTEWREGDDGPTTLAPGRTAEYTVVATPTGCASAGSTDAPAGDQGVAVQPGRHELWVVMLHGDADGPEERRRAVGGPWPLTLD